jgi:hypothetical protein
MAAGPVIRFAVLVLRVVVRPQFPGRSRPQPWCLLLPCALCHCRHRLSGGCPPEVASAAKLIWVPVLVTPGRICVYCCHLPKLVRRVL